MAIKKESTCKVASTLPTANRNCTTDFDELQSKFSPKVAQNFKLVETLQRLGLHEQADNVQRCGSFLIFKRGISDNGEIADKSQLHRANFCKNRLCPMCAWRRGLKMYSQAIQITQVMAQDHNAIFLTLTAPNVAAEQLPKQLERMQLAWDRLCHLKKVKSIMQGYIKALEITYNVRTDTYHPHYHVVVFVAKDYGTNGYIEHNEWLQMWRNSMQDQSIMFVNVKRIYANESKGTDAFVSAVAETCKYPFKPSALNFDNAVETLYKALKGVRTISMGGKCKEIAKLLKLDDIEQGDLVATDLEHVEQYNAFIFSYYGREYGSVQYQLFKQTIGVNINE